jgi:prevent-host-death family protein
MRTVTAREAHWGFSDLLAKVEQGEEVLITKRGRPVAVIAPYREPVTMSQRETDPATTPEREAAIQRALELMRKGLPFSGRHFTRDDMHER